MKHQLKLNEIIYKRLISGPASFGLGSDRKHQLSHLIKSRCFCFFKYHSDISFKAISFQSNATKMNMFIKWSSLQRSVSRFMPKQFYDIDPRADSIKSFLSYVMQVSGSSSLCVENLRQALRNFRQDVRFYAHICVKCHKLMQIFL